MIQSNVYLPVTLGESSRVRLIQGVLSIQVPIQVTCYDTVKPVFTGHPRGKL